MTAEDTPRWEPALAVLVFVLLWVLLAVRSPTTTYHFAPMLVAGSASVTARWLVGAPVRPRATLGWAGFGLLVALAVTAVLAYRGALAGPDFSGGDAALEEAVLLAVLGAAVGWRLARRRGRSVSR